MKQQRLTCKRCALPQLPGFVGRAFCRYHWAGQLAGTPGEVPSPLLADWHTSLSAHHVNQARNARKQLT